MSSFLLNQWKHMTVHTGLSATVTDDTEIISATVTVDPSRFLSYRNEKFDF